MDIKTSKFDIMWSYLGYFFGYASNLIIVLFVMSNIPSAELGLWYSFLNMGAFVGILDFGISNTLIRNVTYAWSGASKIEKEGFSRIEDGIRKTNFVLLKQIIDGSKYICLVIALFALFVMGSIGTLYIVNISKELNGNGYLVAWVLYVVSVFLNIYYTFWSTALKGIGAIKESQIANVIARIVQILVSIIGVYLGLGIVSLAAAYLVYGLVLRVISKVLMYQYENLGEKLRNLPAVPVKKTVKEIFPTIWYNAKKVGLVSFSTFLIKQTTSIVCSLYLGLEETASYGLCLQIFAAIAGVSLILFQTESPMLISFKVRNDIDKLKKHLSISVVAYWSIYIIITIIFLMIGLPIVRVLKSNTELPLMMVIFVGFYTFLENNHSMFATYIAMSNTIPYVKASVLSGGLIMILSFLSGYLGGNIYDLMMVQCFVQLAYNNWKWPYVVFCELQLSPFDMVKISKRESKNILNFLKK